MESSPNPTIRTSFFWSNHLLLFVGIVGCYVLHRVFDLPIESAVSFLVGFSWISLVDHPMLAERVNTNQYRFSFARSVFLLDQKLKNSLKTRKFPFAFILLIRSAFPFIFTLLLWFLSKQGQPVLAYTGALLAGILNNFLYRNTLTKTL